MFKQSSIVAVKPLPFASESIKSLIHAPLPSTSSVVRTPFPAGITQPVKLNPRTILFPVEIINPKDSASPPEALIKITFSI